jgi:NitT/TauT family transport system permease protein
MRFITKRFSFVGALIFWCAVWFFAARIVGQELILPGPGSVLKTLFTLARTGVFWLSVVTTLGGIVAGFLTGAAAGIALGALCACLKPADIFLSPLIRVIRATPVASFIVLALLWIGKRLVPATISALMVLPVVWQTVYSAVPETDAELLEMARMFRFGLVKKLRLIYVPSLLPTLTGACSTAVGLAWKSGVAAEVICQVRNTIGAGLYNSKIYLETPELFAWTAVVVALSLALERAIGRLLKR